MLLSPSDLAKKLGFSVSQIRRLICKGIIPAEKLGTYYAIDEKKVPKLVRSRSPNGSRKKYTKNKSKNVK